MISCWINVYRQVQRRGHTCLLRSVAAGRRSCASFQPCTPSLWSLETRARGQTCLCRKNILHFAKFITNGCQNQIMFTLHLWIIFENFLGKRTISILFISGLYHINKRMYYMLSGDGKEIGMGHIVYFIFD